MKKVTVFVVLLIVGVLLFSPFLRMQTEAAMGPTFLFLERMKVSTGSNTMVLLITPGQTLNSGTDARIIRVYFPEGLGAWCDAGGLGLTVTLTATGVTSSAVDTTGWDIGAALPGTLTATCTQAASGARDYLTIEGIGNLTAATSYGVQISPHASFRTGASAGSNTVSVQLIEGAFAESITFGVSLSAEDQVTVSATVSDADTITCSVGSTVNLGTLYKGGAYSTGSHTITTNSTSSFYWAVYGTGNGSAAGLYKSDSIVYLIPSSATTVNLITDEGFGIVVTPGTSGTAATNYGTGTPGTFGGVEYSFAGANLIMSHSAGTSGEENSTVTVGARAGTGSETGTYQETLTYICGAYIDAT